MTTVIAIANQKGGVGKTTTAVTLARQTGQIQSNPTEHVKSVTVAARGPKWLDKRQQHALIRAIEKDLQLAKTNFPKRWVTRRRDASLVLLLLHTGLRLGETI